MKPQDRPTAPPKLVYTRIEAAKAIGIKPRLLSTLTADRTSGIPFVKLGRRIVFPVDELKGWLSDQVAGGVKDGGR
jgi:hypothetical protein